MMKRFKLGMCAAALLVVNVANAAPLVISGMSSGWTSGDTRTSTGAQADAAQIAMQIKFLGEGVAAADASGAIPDLSPTGSLGGNGYMRLDGTSSNSGKSDIGYVNLAGIAAASALIDDDFSLSFRHLRDPNPTSRTVGQSIGVSDGLVYYNFSYVETTAGANQWLTSSITATSGTYYLYGTGSAGGAGPRKTLAEWAVDATWGYLFGDTFDVVRLGFNIGSSSQRGLVYVDWLQTSLLNDGDVIDFAAPTAEVPEPQTLMLVAVALLGAGVVRRRRA